MAILKIGIKFLGFLLDNIETLYYVFFNFCGK